MTWKPYYKKVRISEDSNLINVYFSFTHDKEKRQAFSVAKELIEEIRRHITVEDYDVSSDRDNIIAFIVSDEFVSNSL